MWQRSVAALTCRHGTRTPRRVLIMLIVWEESHEFTSVSSPLVWALWIFRRQDRGGDALEAPHSRCRKHNHWPLCQRRLPEEPFDHQANIIWMVWAMGSSNWLGMYAMRKVLPLDEDPHVHSRGVVPHPTRYLRYRCTPKEVLPLPDGS